MPKDDPLPTPVQRSVKLPRNNPTYRMIAGRAQVKRLIPFHFSPGYQTEPDRLREEALSALSDDSREVLGADVREFFRRKIKYVNRSETVLSAY
jgi:ribonuclease BN (tRNA processing enzyme)